VGDNAAPSFVGDNARSFTKDLRPILGLQGPQYAAYPFLDPVTTAEQSRHQFISLLPRSADVAKYFDFYRQVVYVHSRMLVDINGFENYVRSYMETYDAHEQNPGDKRMLERLEHDVSYIALLLATLASGSQFSDLKLAQRIALSRDFSRRSFQCLRLANFLFRPSMEVIQALLILGTVLQNDGQSDGAWSLLGLTVRLAQCLGLHTERSARIQPREVQEKRKYLWNNVMWQDALLSLSYDRIPALAAYRTSPVEANRQNLAFVPAMHILCRIGLVSLVYSGDAELQVGPLVQCLADCDELYQALAPHLKSTEVCTNLQEKREFLAFRLHFSFLVSMLARPAFRSGNQQPADQQGYDALVERGRNALCAATEAYLDLHLIDVYPRRSWGMIHQGLSSALLLGILGESKRRPEIVDLQLRVIDVLSTSEEADVSGGDVPTAWLSSSHVRALRALRSTVQNGSRRSSQSSMITTEPPLASASIMPATNMPPSAKDEAPAIPWVVPVPNGANEMVFDPNLVNGYDGGIPMDFGAAMQHTGLSPMTYFDALYWGKARKICGKVQMLTLNTDPNFDNMATWNAPPQQGYWGL
jgi:hypothetical protein